MPERCLRYAALLFACAVVAAPARAGERSLDAGYFDTSISPCRDFFQYANGGWLKSNPIPADYSRWSLDDEINERTLSILKRILENAAAHPAGQGSTLRKIGDFYAAAMNETAIERAGLAPVQSELQQIAALKSATDVAALIRDWQVRGIDILFNFQAQEDLKDSGANIAYAAQGGLGLPDRDYYLRKDVKSRLLRVQYQAHIARMLALLGDGNAKTEAVWVLALETRLAKASLDNIALLAPENSYHIYTIAQADAKTPHFSWHEFFSAAGRSDVQRFSLAQPDFFAAADQALTDVPLSHWQAYLRWQLIDDAAPFLGKGFVDADFDFHEHILRGTRAIQPRWKRAIASVDQALGEALGQEYVAQTFPPTTRQRALDLVANLKLALRARLEHLTWMSAATKQMALAKLDALTAKIGYPDKWRDYSKLEISTTSYYLNMRAAAAFEAQRQFAKFDRPVDKSEWDLTPQTLNAYNNPARNEIVFPAAQLLPPYFDASADDALNYGGIGAVIGHEMLHSFDDQGSKFDAHGNLADWWASSDRAQFDARGKKLVEQFNAYVPIDNLHVNGELTLGENIADLGGLLVAYDAFKLTAQGKGDEKIDGLTPDQRFFLAYAQTWRTAQQPQQLRLQLQSNEHAPAKFRVLGPLGNTPAFAQAFACKTGDAMVRSADARIEIW